jgi:cysteine desulfurase
MRKIIYLDNAATTPVRKEVFLAMKPYWSEDFGNPGSITKMGVKAKLAVENSRRNIADVLIVRPQEIIFTSGGTESNNLAIFGLVNHLVSQTRHSSLEKEESKSFSNMHFITTNIEHSSVTVCFKELQRRGAKVDYLAVKENGIIDTHDLRKLIKPNTVLISIGYANNEIGVIQPIKEITKEVRHARKMNKNNFPIFHTDASQAGLYCNLNLNELGVDLMTLDAQKINGPKGVGLLYIKAGVELSPLIFGGGQEKGLRSGTENVPLIVGMAKALEMIRGAESAKALGVIRSAVKRRELLVMKIKKLRDYFWQKIQQEIPEAVLNGDLENRLPNNLNISISGIDSEFTVLCLDEVGIVCSTKSACNRDDDGSFVVRALGKTDDLVKSTLRFSLSENITKLDINFVVTKLKSIIKKQLEQKYI